MDEHHDDDLDDELGTALRRRADELTGSLDVDTALTAVVDRARARRRWRTVATTLTAAAAVIAVIVVGVATLGRDDGGVVRGPAATPPIPSSSAVAPASVPATTTTDTAASTTAPTTTALATTAPPTSAASTITPFTSVGGSIEVRLADGRIDLAGDPVASDGWTVRIDDNGPTRVRVRFEDGSRRSEIRIDLEGGSLVPRISDD
jgi:hypothetical protein